jgi:hypothetical protein
VRRIIVQKQRQQYHRTPVRQGLVTVFASGEDPDFDRTVVDIVVEVGRPVILLPLLLDNDSPDNRHLAFQIIWRFLG